MSRAHAILETHLDLSLAHDAGSNSKVNFPVAVSQGFKDLIVSIMISACRDWAAVKGCG